MFRWLNGKTPEKSLALESHELPYYMKLGVEYECVDKPISASLGSHDGPSVSVHLIRVYRPLAPVLDPNTKKKEDSIVQNKKVSVWDTQHWFIHTSLALPKRFWIRIITGRKIPHKRIHWINHSAASIHETTYEILDGADDGTPRQILRMNAPTLQFMANGKKATPLSKA